MIFFQVVIIGELVVNKFEMVFKVQNVIIKVGLNVIYNFFQFFNVNDLVNSRFKIFFKVWNDIIKVLIVDIQIQNVNQVKMVIFQVDIEIDLGIFEFDGVIVQILVDGFQVQNLEFWIIIWGKRICKINNLNVEENSSGDQRWVLLVVGIWRFVLVLVIIQNLFGVFFNVFWQMLLVWQNFLGW